MHSPATSGAKGPLVEEEAKLLRLRQEIEGEARDELQRARTQLEDEARNTASGKLCATPFGVDVVGITEVIALTGALVGGETPHLPYELCGALCDSSWVFLGKYLRCANKRGSGDHPVRR